MKTKIAFISLLTILLASCSDSFLVRDPYGSVITQGQYEKLANQLEGSMRGIYSMMYTHSDHDEFGKRSIDMYGDIMSGDMALTNNIYGWFYTDELTQGRTGRTGYLWSYYYGMLHNINAVLFAAQGGEAASADNVIKRIQAVGLPTHVDKSGDDIVYYTINAEGDTLATYTEVEAAVANCYAQALTMRGYAYSNLLLFYTYTSDNISSFDRELTIPVYTEFNMDYAQGLATLTELYDRIETDLTTAIDYFDAFTETQRSSKLEVDATVAAGLLAYSYLNKGKPHGHGDANNAIYQKAIDFAELAILKSKCEILPRRDILETGFNDVNGVSWMWGEDVTIETASGLGSFFGQVDIHSYSYAWAGDTKAIDENLYKEIPDYDIRKQWFNDGSANATYKLCPDGKFFSAKARYSTDADDIDREWLSDNVYMRIESMYLIAAEAYYRLGKEDEAREKLWAITDLRVNEEFQDQYDAAKNWTDLDLLRQIEYNWRIELWGEGYGLMTFRRLSPETTDAVNERRRGANHKGNPGTAMTADDKYIFQMPSSEFSYNPNIND